MLMGSFLYLASGLVILPVFLTHRAATSAAAICMFCRIWFLRQVSRSEMGESEKAMEMVRISLGN